MVHDDRQMRNRLGPGQEPGVKGGTMKGVTVGANGQSNPEASISRTGDRRRRRAARTMVGLALVSSVVMTYTPIDTAFAATTFTVNTTVDAVDTNPGDGACSTGAGSCSLRAAIQEANALAGPDTINVTAGVYSLSIFGAAEDLAGTGVTVNILVPGGPGLDRLQRGRHRGGREAPRGRVRTRRSSARPRPRARGCSTACECGPAARRDGRERGRQRQK